MTPRLAKLRWRCRRGMRELDAALESFLDRAGEQLDAQDIERFEAILELPDPELYAYLLGRSEHADPDTARLFERIRRSVSPPA